MLSLCIRTTAPGREGEFAAAPVTGHRDNHAFFNVGLRGVWATAAPGQDRTFEQVKFFSPCEVPALHPTPRASVRADILSGFDQRSDLTMTQRPSRRWDMEATLAGFDVGLPSMRLDLASTPLRSTLRRATAAGCRRP